MLNAIFNGMHLHTRASGYADRTRQGRIKRGQRPGAYSFTFSGEFPEIRDMQPVESSVRSRDYMAHGSMTGGYRPVGSMDTARDPIVSRFGVKLMPALAALMLLVACMGIALGLMEAQCTSLSKQITAQMTEKGTIEDQTDKTLEAMAKLSDDVTIRRAAVKLGLVSSEGVAPISLTAPEGDMPGPGASLQGMAAVFGQ